MKKSSIEKFIPYKNLNYGIAEKEEYVAYNTFKHIFYPLFRVKTGLFSYEWYFFHDKDSKSIYFYEQDDAVKYLNIYN